MVGSAGEAPSRGGWQRYIRDPVDLKIGIGVGWLFVLVIVLLQEVGLFPQDPDYAADRLVPYLEGVVQHERQVKPFVFIDIDNRTYEEWNQPLFTPRDKLAKLIEEAAKGDPTVIVVDIDLSRASDTPVIKSDTRVINKSEPGQAKTCDDLPSSDDRALCKAITDARVPIVLARNFNFGARERERGGAVQPLPSVLDPVFGTGPAFAKANSGSDLWASPRYPNVFWASPLYDLDEERTIRHWRLWEPACVDGRLIAMPSTQLLVATLVRNASPQVGLTHLRAHLILKDDRSCAASPLLNEPNVSLTAHAREPHLDLSQSRFSQRIVYTLSKEVGLRTTVPIATKNPGGMHPEPEEQVPILFAITAHDMAPEPPPDPSSNNIDPEIFNKRIVVIGASHHESGDNHWTPKGTMPGAVVNINAIHTLLDYGQLTPPTWIERILISGVIVTVIAVLFHVFYYSISMYLSLLIVSLALVVVNAFTLKWSVLFDVSLAGLIFAFYKWFVIGFFNVLHKGWKIEKSSADEAGRRIWRWHVRKKDGVGWKALLHARYQKDPASAKQ